LLYFKQQKITQILHKNPCTTSLNFVFPTTLSAKLQIGLCWENSLARKEILPKLDDPNLLFFKTKKSSIFAATHSSLFEQCSKFRSKMKNFAGAQRIPLPALCLLGFF
jgi:hypothetical protein